MPNGDRTLGDRLMVSFTKSKTTYAGTFVVLLYIVGLSGYAWHERLHMFAMAPDEFATFLSGVLAPLGVLGLLLTIMQARTALARATEANSVTTLIGQAQVRCYPAPRDVTLQMNDSGQPTVTLTVANSGQSPARGFNFSFDVRLRKLPDGWLWEFKGTGEDNTSAGRDIGAGGHEHFSVTICSDGVLPQDDLSDFLLTPLVLIKVEIAAVWEDVFGKTFRESWRFQAMESINLLDNAAPLWPDTPSAIRLL